MMSETLANARAAEQLLFELARDLRYVPIEPRTMRAHLRALELKREVRTWAESSPDEATVKGVLAEIRRLSAEAHRLRAATSPPHHDQAAHVAGEG